MLPASRSVLSGPGENSVSLRFTTRVNMPVSRNRRTISFWRMVDISAAARRSSSSLMAESVTGNLSIAMTL